MSASRRKRTAGKGSSLWIFIWAIGSILPFIPYSQPLWLATWSDNPYAYLVWVPLFAFIWAGWSIWRNHVKKDDPEVSYMFGLVVAILCGSLLVVGRLRWDLVFVGQNIGLLLWPVWALGLAWWIFGISVTRTVWKPLVYLLLCWPALYSEIVQVTNPVLDGIANAGVSLLSHWFSWLHVTGTVGAYTVAHHGIQTLVHVTSVCNGADSFLAMVILFPIIMVSYTKGFWKKASLLVLGAVLAILGNVVRLWLILFALHWFGTHVALGILHPVLGVLLFLLMFAIIVWAASFVGLKSVGFQRTGTPLPRPGFFSLSSSVLATIIVTVLVWPILSNTTGSVLNPKVLTSDNLSKVLPSLPGWSRSLVGNYDEASTLGPGAKSTAVIYTTVQGDYSLAEMWWTYKPMVLKGYSEQNCLLFHGSKIIDTQQIKVGPGLTADVYTVYLPARTVGGNRDIYVDTVYSYSAKYHGKTVYIRMELAAPILLNAPENKQTTALTAQLVSKLLNSKYNHVRQLAPVGINQTVHLHNYVTFVHEFSQELL